MHEKANLIRAFGMKNRSMQLLKQVFILLNVATLIYPDLMSQSSLQLFYVSRFNWLTVDP